MKYFVVGIVTTVLLGVTFVSGAMVGFGLHEYDDMRSRKNQRVNYNTSYKDYTNN